MTIDLTGIDTKAAFHMLMKRELGFPDWYGVSWDAFWDAIIAVVEMPDTVVLQHWQAFAHACPKDMLILRDIIANYPLEKPGKQLLLGS
ncbi:MAG: hypothetical protein JWP58_2433 [Hymenobacter sp.]|nr:hypothetical protein [Hymenobacter sp.]